MKLINSYSNPIRVGSVVCVPGKESEVSQKDIDEFKKSKIGKSLYGLFLKPKDDKPDDDKTDKTDKTKGKSKPSTPFLFDPKKHKVSHRGGGKWYIMEGDEKIKGPLTPEEKIIFQGMESTNDD